MAHLEPRRVVNRRRVTNPGTRNLADLPATHPLQIEDRKAHPNSWAGDRKEGVTQWRQF